MKDTFTDANFPRTSNGRVYHLGLRTGEVANRIITVGPSSRAEDLARFLDGDAKSVFKLTSERAFLTFTGRYHGVPVTIVAMGMGAPNMDFFVREIRECVSGDLAIIRLGSCGCLDGNIPVGSLVVPSASVAVNRNYDYPFVEGGSEGSPYLISKPVSSDPKLSEALCSAFSGIEDRFDTKIVTDTVNASADSFYSSQGRLTSFMDRNEDLIDRLQATVPKLATLEMETFHLLHLASVWKPQVPIPANPSSLLPPTNLPVKPIISHIGVGGSTDRHDSDDDSDSDTNANTNTSKTASTGTIRAAAVHMVYANRITSAFITPDVAEDLQKWAGEKILGALVAFEMDSSASKRTMYNVESCR